MFLPPFDHGEGDGIPWYPCAVAVRTPVPLHEVLVVGAVVVVVPAALENLLRLEARLGRELVQDELLCVCQGDGVGGLPVRRDAKVLAADVRRVLHVGVLVHVLVVLVEVPPVDAVVHAEVVGAGASFQHHPAERLHGDFLVVPRGVCVPEDAFLPTLLFVPGTILSTEIFPVENHDEVVIFSSFFPFSFFIL